MAKAKKLKIFRKKAKAPGAVLLYIFLVPLFLSTAGSLFDGDYSKFVLKLIAFALLYISVYLVEKGLKQEFEYNQKSIALAPKIKYKLLGSIGLGVAVLFLGLVVDKIALLNSVFNAILAFAGGVIYYGFDPSSDKIPQESGVNYKKLIKDIQEAQNKLLNIEEAKDKISDLELKEAIGGALQRAEKILQNIKEDPKDIRVARKFMVVYLDGIKDVIKQYNEIDEQILDKSYRTRLIELLDKASNRFDEELERLKSNELFDLDVQIDTLKKQLES